MPSHKTCSPQAKYLSKLLTTHSFPFLSLSFLEHRWMPPRCWYKLKRLNCFEQFPQEEKWDSIILTELSTLSLSLVSVSKSWDPMDCSPQGSFVHGILQARMLEWVSISFSKDFPDPGIEPWSPALQADSLPTELWGNARTNNQLEGYFGGTANLCPPTHWERESMV